MKKIILSTLLVAISSYSSANSCLKSYEVRTNPHALVNSAFLPETSIALRSVVANIKPTNLELQVAVKNFEKFQAKEKTDEKVEKLEKLNENKLSPEIAEIYLKKLIKSGFLLGPLHELLLSRTVGINTFGFEKQKSKYELPMDKYSYSLDEFKSRLDLLTEQISGKNEEGKIAKEKIAKEMYWLLFGMFRENGKLMTSEELKFREEYLQINFLNKSIFYRQDLSLSYYYKTNDKKELQSVYAILDILNSPNHQEFFIKTFEDSLGEVLANIKIKTTSKGGTILAKTGVITSGISIAALPYFASLMIPGYSLELMYIISGVGGFGVTLFAESVYLSMNERIKSALINVRNVIKTRAISKKVVKSLDDKSEVSVAKELAEIESSADLLDLDFSFIKFEILKELNNVSQIPQWGSELSRGVSNITLRINLLLEQYQEIVKQMDPVIKKAMNSETQSSLNLKVSAEKNDLVKMKFFRLLVDIKAIKTDTLALSIALDQYLAKAKEHKENSSTDVSQYFINDKLRQFLNEIELLKATGKGINTIENQLMKNIETLNVIYHAQDINVIMSLEDRLKIGQ